MKKRMGAIIVAMALATGCAAGTAVTGTGGVGAGSVGTIPQGYADLRVTGTFKTHKPGDHYAQDAHGTPDYKVRLEIDGREVDLPGQHHEELTEARSGDAEAGPGVRYRFDKTVRVPAGSHKVVIAIPADRIAVAREMSLAEGSSNTLRFEPLYSWVLGRQRPASNGVTTFRDGIGGFRIVLNEKAL